MHCFSFGLLPLGTGVGIVVHTSEMVEIQLGVVLGGGELTVAEQLLYSTDVAGVLQQVASIAVAQHMGTEVAAAVTGGELLQAFLDLAGTEAAAGTAGEEGCFVGRGGTGFQVAFEGADALSGEGKMALFAAFAGYGHPAALQVKVGQVESTGFSKAQAAAVEQLKDGKVSTVEQIFWGLVEELVERLGRYGFGQAFRGSGGFKAVGGVGFQIACSHQPAAKLPPSAEAAGDAVWVLVLLAKLTQGGGEQWSGKCALRLKIGQPGEVSAVGGQGVGGVVLLLQAVQPDFDLCYPTAAHCFALW